MRRCKGDKSGMKMTKKDRLSQLPDEILVIILSRLFIKEAAQTSILSHRWRSLWTFTTTLDFDSSSKGAAGGVWGSDSQHTQSQLGLGFRGLNQALKSHKAPTLHKLRICLGVMDSASESDIARWLDVATNKCVQHLDLQFESLQSRTRTSFPFPSLGFSNFNSLKTLFIRNANLADKHVHYFLSNCPSLERLCLAESPCIGNLTISGDSLKLKYLEICCCFNLRSLLISAPNLVSLKYWGPDINLTLHNVPLLVEVSFLEAYCISLVKNKFKQFSSVISQLQTLKLTLSYPWLTQFPKLDGLSNLNKLELDLVVWDFDNPFHLCTSLMKALPLLFNFSLHLFWSVNFECSEIWVPLVVENHRHHCLKVVELVGFVGCMLDIEIARYLGKNAVSLEKMTVNPCRQACIDDLVDLMTIKEKQEVRNLAYELGGMLSSYAQLVVL